MRQARHVLGVIVDGNGDDVVAVRLVAWVVKLRYIRVSQCLLRRDSLTGIELKQADEEVLGLGGRVGKQLQAPRNLSAAWQLETRQLKCPEVNRGGRRQTVTSRKDLGCTLDKLSSIVAAKGDWIASTSS